MKSYTDLEQSKKLAEILPLESADMCYVIDYAESNKYGSDCFKLEVDTYGLKVQTMDNIPSWSLAALLEILAKIASKIDDDGSAYLSSFMGQWSVNMLDCPVEATDNYGNPVDACYEMVLKLNELKLL